jgi:exopolysaccharide biosynthesis polyprenyl glycosylphosphotransferase
MKGVTIITVVLYLVQIVFPIEKITVTSLEVFWILCISFLIMIRLTIRGYLVMVSKNSSKRKKILIVGSNDRAINYAYKFIKNNSSGYEIAGFIDSGWHGTQQINQRWCKLVADFKSFAEYLRLNIIDEIFIFLPLKSSYCAIENIVAASEEQGVTIRMIPDFFKLQLARNRIDKIENQDTITLYTGAMYSNIILIKEIIDRTTAGLLLIALLPLFIIVSILIKVTSKGPVFFRQNRIGLNKRRFKIYKFRTMASDAEVKQKDLEHLNDMGKNAGAFKLKNDPRVTPLGKILRKFSIDELPQLINVLKGEMSLVGPRPLTERDYGEFRLHRQIRRFTVKPGITCLWQVSGRNNISFDRWMELDMEYIDNWSLMLDFKLLIKTVPAVLFGHGAS